MSRVPTTVTEVRSFLGLTGYYQRFVEGFSRLALPLAQLMRKGEKFMWTDERQESFEELKRRLVSAPILTLPSSSGGFQIYRMHRERKLGELVLCSVQHFILKQIVSQRGPSQTLEDMLRLCFRMDMYWDVNICALELPTIIVGHAKHQGSDLFELFVW
ncbi:hypothetical protein Tco_0616519 [Tanacetum coccineum]